MTSNKTPPRYITYNGCKYRLAEIKPRIRKGHDLTLLSEEGNPLEGELLISVDYPEETRALYLDPIYGSFFAKFSGKSGDNVLELTKEDAKKFFLELLRAAGIPKISTEQARQIWSPKALPERTSSYKPMLYTGRRSAAVLSIRDEKLRESVDTVRGGFCYPPNFDVIGWKYDVPDEVAHEFVGKLTDIILIEYPHLNSVDISLKRAPSGGCLGGVFAFNGVREVRPVTAMLDDLVYNTWRKVYEEYKSGPLVTGSSSLGEKLRSHLEEVRETGGDIKEDTSKE